MNHFLTTLVALAANPKAKIDHKEFLKNATPEELDEVLVSCAAADALVKKLREIIKEKVIAEKIELQSYKIQEKNGPRSASDPVGFYNLMKSLYSLTDAALFETGVLALSVPKSEEVAITKGTMDGDTKEDAKTRFDAYFKELIKTGEAQKAWEKKAKVEA
jgi:hypothetical protein